MPVHHVSFSPQLQIRKTHREQNLAKKRAELFAGPDGVTPGAGAFGGLPGQGGAGDMMGQQHGMGGAGGMDASVGAGGVGQPQADVAFKTERLPEMMAMLMSDDPQQQFNATEQFRRALSIESRPPIQEVIEAGKERKARSLAVSANRTNAPPDSISTSPLASHILLPLTMTEASYIVLVSEIVVPPA